MIGRLSSAVLLLLLLIVPLGVAAPMVVAEGAANRQAKEQKAFSPLHDFLGIDPETGKFVDPKTAPARPSAGSGSPAADGPAESSQTVQDRLPKDAEEAADAVRKVADRINEGSFEDLSSLVDQRLSTDRLTRMSRQLAWITAGVLLLYPLSMAASELLGWWFHRSEGGLTDLDRRYRRVRLRRRLLLASTMMGLILIATIGSLNSYWWGQPELFTIFCIAIALLGIAAATLSSLIKQAAKEYSLTLIRQMRREQLEMRADLDDLCKRMRQVTMTSD